ncbi:MAG: VWA domain-containing protein [Chloroflexota bacterium]|nr:VWA domain-containing protein [Chloroflexota bacterium]
MSSLRLRRVRSLPLLIAFIATLLTPLGTLADGVIIVEPPICETGACPEPVRIGDQLVVRSHRVDVAIAEQVATTRIDQVFHNPNSWVAEGTYIFPLPEGATVSKFSMTVDGQPVEAHILDADQARAIYEEIVRSMRDPALLEYVGEGAIQVSVFPIGPGEDRQVNIEYEEVLRAENGLVRYRYPLNTERFSAQPLEQVSIRVSVQSTAPIRAVYSPSHNIAVDRSSDGQFVAGWEAADVLPATDFDLFYSVAEEQIGANLISTYDPLLQEGHFLFIAAPGVAASANAPVVAKDVVVVLDTSGSMEGEKIVQARSALTYVLGHLNPEDRFNVVEFSTGAREYAPNLLPASEAKAAIPWAEGLQATGGTDINLALLEAMAMVRPERPTYLLFLTDGLPTEGETDPTAILANVAAAAPPNVRLFAFGVGDDVDTFLLDSLTEAHSGRSTYIRPGEPVDEIVSGFYSGITTPVLANLQLNLGDAVIEDLYPTPLPDLFAGGQLVVAGRYRAGGPAAVTLSGEVNGQPQTFTYENLALATGPTPSAEFVPRLWATRKIGHLLTQIRLHGESPELVDAVVDLSVRYGIVTPYTSYLITEDDILTQEGRDEAAQNTLRQLATQETAPASGAQAVEEAAASGDLADAEVAQAPSAEYGEAVRVIGSRAFVRQGDVWVETTYDPSTMTPIEVQFGSEEYFRLIAEDPALAEAFALGPRVIAVSGGQAYEVVE